MNDGSCPCVRVLTLITSEGRCGSGETAPGSVPLSAEMILDSSSIHTRHTTVLEHTPSIAGSTPKHSGSLR